MQQFALPGESWNIGKIINYDQDAEELLLLLLLLELYDFVLGLDDARQRFGVVVVEVDRLFLVFCTFISFSIYSFTGFQVASTSIPVSYTHLTLPTKA